MRLNHEPETFQQRLGARAVRSAIAGRIVARHLDELGQERRFTREFAIHECGDMFRQGHP